MASGSRALPDLVARIRLDSSGVDQGFNALLGNFSKTNLALGVAAGALGAVVAAAVNASDKYLNLAESVHRYMAVTGETAPVAGAQVQAFKELGVSEDVAEAAMAKLSKAIETTPKKLEALGVAIQHTKTGSVDLNATLLNVIDAWNGTEDAAKRNELALIAFGRGGVQAMLPILEAGTQKIRELEAAVRLVFTEKDIEAAHQYALEQKQVQASTDSVWQSLGQKLLPSLKAVDEAYLQNEYVTKRIAEAEKNNTNNINNSRVGRAELVAQYRKEYDAAQAATLKLGDLTDAQNQAATAAEALAKQIDDATNAMESAASTSIALQRADLKVAESADRVTKAQDAYNQAVKDYGPDSEQARVAADVLTTTILDQKQAYIDAAGQAQKLAEEQAGPDATATDKATAGHQAYLKKLQEEAATLAPGSALRNYLQQYIDQLDSIPVGINTALSLSEAGGIAGGRRYLAEGGPALPNSVYTVGESGPETLVMGAQGGYVIPHGGSGGGGGGSTINLTQHIYGSVQTERDLALTIRETIRRLDREQR